MRHTVPMEFHLKVIEGLSKLLDKEFKIFNIRIGLDPLIGLIPGIGDVISLILSLYIIWVATQFKLPQDKLVMMIGNVVFDFILGLFPLVGDAADFLFRANHRNMKILHTHLNENKIVDGEMVLKG